jgi:uracil-DNA glycosylase
VKQQLSRGKVIFPPTEQVFSALSLCPWDKLRVVILGQDPYHGKGQAMGLSFSVPAGVKFPPSLVNIFKELVSDMNVPAPAAGDLSPWARQGVLLLNTVLTVEEAQPQSHQGQGWEELTDCIIRTVGEKKEHVVFVLWGGPAQKKRGLIDESKHLVLTAPHPSPLSSYRGFFGSRPFSKINAYLREHEKEEINWAL